MSVISDLLDDPLPDGVAPAAAAPSAVQITALDDAQEKQLLELWNKNPNNPPSLKELTQTMFGHECDGRSAEGRAIRKALAKHNIRAKSSFDPDRPPIELSEAHKIYIANNAKSMSSIDMARIIFANDKLTPLHAECRAVHAYMHVLQPTVMFMPGASEEVPDKPYEPPKSISQALDKVNQYINFCLDASKLTAAQKKNLSTLIGYLHTYRFVAQMNNYTRMFDRQLCEDAFIRSTWDKPDLAQEEVDQYIEYANQVVDAFTIQRRKNQLNQQLEDITTANDDTLKISMSLVEAIGKAGTEYQQSLGRQQKLLDDLKEKRSTRMSKQLKENASILNLIQMWRSEETRREMLVHAEREQQKVSDEVDRLSTMSELKARIMGLTKDEIRYG